MISRRHFNVGTLAGIGGLAAASLTTSQANAQMGGRIRRDVFSLDPNGPELSDYRNAVTAMRALPHSDPRSWNAQAGIHEAHCPHGNWFFLPWHRAYLHYFEKICAELSGNPEFALPYWNWSRFPSIPAALLDSPLLHDRDLGPGDALPAELIAQSRIDRLMQIPEFPSFASGPPNGTGQGTRGQMAELEFGPHNGVHEELGRDMMTSWSPLDPIFWLHHCNIDRLWASWNRQFSNSEDATWADFNITRFYDVSTNQQVTPRVGDLDGIAPLNYAYDFLEGDPNPPEPASPGTTPNPPSLIGREGAWQHLLVANASRASSRLQIKNASELSERPSNWRARSIWATPSVRPGSPAAQRLAPAQRYAFQHRTGTSAFLNVDHLPVPRNQKSLVRVFLNRDNLSPTTLFTDAHYVSTVAFFGHGHHGQGSANLRIDLTSTLARLTEQGVIDFQNRFPQVQLIVVDETRSRMLNETLSGPQRTRIEFAEPEGGQA